MMIKEKVLEALNKQLNQELYASYLYLSMAAYLDSQSFTGFATWMRIQSQEEYGHAMKIFEFILNVDARVSLAKIDAPKTEWKSPTDVFEDVYQHEKKVTASIYEIVNLSSLEKDHAVTTFLQWFVNEQVEEESTASKILDRLKLVDSKNGLFLLDREMAQRAGK